MKFRALRLTRRGSVFRERESFGVCVSASEVFYKIRIQVSTLVVNDIHTYIYIYIYIYIHAHTRAEPSSDCRIFRPPGRRETLLASTRTACCTNSRRSRNANRLHTSRFLSDITPVTLWTASVKRGCVFCASQPLSQISVAVLNSKLCYILCPNCHVIVTHWSKCSCTVPMREIREDSGINFRMCRMGAGRWAAHSIVNTFRKTVVIGQKGIQPKRGMLTEKKLDVVGAMPNISSKISWIRVFCTGDRGLMFHVSGVLWWYGWWTWNHA
jgi:hypothetical protein